MRCYIQTVLCLNFSGWIVELLGRPTELGEVTIMDFKQLIRQNYLFLLERLDPSIELLGGLQRNVTLRHRIASIKEKPVQKDMTDALLSVLLKLLDADDDLQDSLMNDVIEALKVSGQGHIANLFRQVTDEVAMSDEHYHRLQTKMAELAKYMDPENELLIQLQSAEVVSSSDVERIRSAGGRNEMTRKLVGHMSLSYFVQYFNQCFKSIIRLLHKYFYKF